MNKTIDLPASTPGWSSGRVKKTDALIETLDHDLHNGNLEIPGFPDILIRLNQALNSENISIKESVILIRSEPGLVSRLMQVANSAAFSRGGQPVTELHSAIARLGFKIVLNTAGSYSINQMRLMESLKAIRPWLAEIWVSSNAVAAITLVIAKEIGFHANEAMLAGMLHRLGHLYLLAQSQQRGIDIHNDPEWDAIVEKWHAAAGSAILLHWGLQSFIADAVRTQDALAQSPIDDLPPFSKLLTAAKLYNSIRNQQHTKQATEVTESLNQTEIWGCNFLTMVGKCHDQIETVRTSIS